MSGPILALRKLLGFWPRSAQEYFDLASEYSIGSQHNAAIETLTEALRLAASEGSGKPEDSQDFLFLVARAEEYVVLGQYQQALVDLNEADRRYGDDFGSLHETRANVLLELSDYRQALELFQQDCKIEDLGPTEIVGCARCFEGLDQQQEAKTAYDLAVRKSEEYFGEADEEIWFYRGRFLLQSGDPASALVDLQKVLENYSGEESELDPECRDRVIDAYRFSARAHEALGDRQAAVAAEESARQVDQARQSHRPDSLRQIRNNVRIEAAASFIGPIIVLSGVLWFLGPNVYEFVSRLMNLPPLPNWWKWVPLSLFASAILLIVILVFASRRNSRSEEYDLVGDRPFDDFR